LEEIEMSFFEGSILEDNED